MDGKKDGGPAYPQNAIPSSDGILTEGMTLRDYFAGQALAGMLGSGKLFIPVVRGDNESQSKTAILCYELADALLAERER